jgi:hypothetical protein
MAARGFTVGGTGFRPSTRHALPHLQQAGRRLNHRDGDGRVSPRGKSCAALWLRGVSPSEAQVLGHRRDTRCRTFTTLSGSPMRQPCSKLSAAAPEASLASHPAPPTPQRKPPNQRRIARRSTRLATTSLAQTRHPSRVSAHTRHHP